MPFSDHEKIASSDKLSLQIAGTANASPGEGWWYNEVLPWAPVIPTSKLWANFDDVPGALTPAAADVNVTDNPALLEKRTIRLTLRLESNDRAYLARSTYGDHSSALLDNGIQPALFQVSGGPSSGYTARLYHGDPAGAGVEITTTQHGGAGGAPAWAFNYAAGLLMVSTDQSSTFRSYYDTDGLWLVWYRYIGALGVSTDSAVKRTTEGFTMSVDPVGGVSPAAGTVVTNQAEYDALGAPLKYLQDALNIIPSVPHILDHEIVVNLEPGNHLAPPNVGVSASIFLALPEYQSSPQANLFNLSGNKLQGVGIRFMGAKSDIESGIAGTKTNYTFTRSSGTWVENELVGKSFLVTSGAGAGSQRVIESNTTTMASFALYTASVGAAIISTQEKTSVLISSRNGTTLTTFGIWDFAGAASNIPIAFYDIAFGSPAMMFSRMGQRGHFNKFYSCEFYCGGFAIQEFGVMRGSVYMQDCYIRLLSNWGIQVEGPEVKLILFGVVVEGGGSLGDLLLVQNGTTLWLYDLILKPTGTWAGKCLNLVNANVNAVRFNCEVKGNGYCTGIRVNGPLIGNYTLDLPFTIKDCAVALQGIGARATGTFVMAGSTGNTVGWKLTDGSDVIVTVGNPSNLEATTELLIDGQAYTYADVLADPGDEVVGPNGSRMLRTI